MAYSSARPGWILWQNPRIMTTPAIRTWVLLAAVAAVVASFVSYPTLPRAASAESPDSGASAASGDSSQPAETAPAAAAPPPALEDGTPILGWAIRELERHRAVSLEMRHLVEIDGITMTGQGIYKQDQLPKMRLEWHTSLDPAEPRAVVMQVCDGQSLLEWRDIRGSQRIQKIDVATVLKALAAEQGKRPPNAPGIPFLGLGGLPQLLRTLDVDLTFVRLADLPGDPPLLRIVGTWKPEALARIVPKPKNGSTRVPRLADVPPTAPTHVELTIDSRNACPRTLRWLHAPKASLDGVLDANPLVLATLEFFGEVYDEPQRADAFVYEPPKNAVVEDVTKAYLQRLGLAAPETPAKK
ncbi:MAG TPA: hypothetical protein VGE52_21700 [Pirellulales bacterium]